VQHGVWAHGGGVRRGGQPEVALLQGLGGAADSGGVPVKLFTVASILQRSNKALPPLPGSMANATAALPTEMSQHKAVHMRWVCHH
jgi:hypothetical protein